MADFIIKKTQINTPAPTTHISKPYFYKKKGGKVECPVKPQKPEELENCVCLYPVLWFLKSSHKFGGLNIAFCLISIGTTTVY